MRKALTDVYERIEFKVIATLNDQAGTKEEKAFVVNYKDPCKDDAVIEPYNDDNSYFI